jgi:hypothetical protein
MVMVKIISKKEEIAMNAVDGANSEGCKRKSHMGYLGNAISGFARNVGQRIGMTSGITEESPEGMTSDITEKYPEDKDIFNKDNEDSIDSYTREADFGTYTLDFVGTDLAEWQIIPWASGGTGRNELSVSADLSQTSLEQALTDIESM